MQYFHLALPFVFFQRKNDVFIIEVFYLVSFDSHFLPGSLCALKTMENFFRVYGLHECKNYSYPMSFDGIIDKGKLPPLYEPRYTLHCH